MSWNQNTFAHSLRRALLCSGALAATASPVQAAEADEADADMLVHGSTREQGNSAIRLFLMGNMSDRAAHPAHCTVLSVKRLTET